MNVLRQARATKVDAYLLPLSRLAYAAMAGSSLVAATFWIDSKAAGHYVYLVGLASVVAALGGFGVERMIARRVAAGELPPSMPRFVLWFRGIEVVVIALGFIIAGYLISGTLFNVGSAVACAIFVASRIFYFDLESLWIAANNSRRVLSLVIFVNAALTGAGVLIGAAMSSPVLMVLGTASGNVVGALVMFIMVPVSGSVLLDWFSEVRGTAVSMGIAAVYGRVDLLLVGLMSVPLTLVAVYGVVLRLFDGLVVLRGAFAQQDARKAAPMGSVERSHFVSSYGVRVLKISVAVAVIAIGIGFLISATTPLGYVEKVGLFLLAAAGIPLFFSHQATTVLILSERRNDLLFVGSLIACVTSVIVKFTFIRNASINGAVLSIALVELVSFAVFAILYLGFRERLVWFVVLGAVTSSTVLYFVVWLFYF